jgi:peptidoglycan-N-acetylglucosamine deacetylase
MQDTQTDRDTGALSRRLLLAVGGVTLLAGCTRAATERIANTAQTHPNTSGTPGTAVRPTPARTTTPPGTTPPGTTPPGTATPGNAGAGRPEFHVSNGPMAIALTIDDGPHPVYTPQVLRILEQYGVTATFSMIGRQVAQLPGIAVEVAAAGHQVSNHTWRHRDLQYLSPANAIDEIDRATDAIRTQIGVTPQYFRAPYGAWTPTVIRHCEQTGMVPLAWSVDPRDWARPGTSYIVTNIIRHTRTGSIILEHDGGGDRSQTVAALRIVIPQLLEAGYHFTTP